MMCNCSVSETNSVNIVQNVTLVPRLDYSATLLSDILDVLKKKKNEIKKTNKIFLSDFDVEDKLQQNALETEKTITFSVEILSQIQKRAKMISGITSIPVKLPSAVPMIRTISAQLFEILPECSQKLSELSVHLGSIILDSATLTKARFDFSTSNEESAILLDEVKLMVDSKINKQYPNLDFFKA
ncbi:hypothetical protein NsoK4_02300 [Nitrosopumilus sp. K4]|uniref:hypothetical protein n=1 Tax=Nitrosopumilus sp. K4 TaxID=2795383 RepID=UPI001BAE0FBC|nr:hypothetical protein [Nitrosopumilus sp. K4]QUC65116.1 hypothetical protein NsoK4_02300 [Nitrosopumilus sp. K4]